MKLNHFAFVCIFFIHQFCNTIASNGDRSPFYQNCINTCSKANCTTDGSFTLKAAQLQDTWSKLLCWSCIDECRYHCMWRTVEGFTERGIEVPKFHGKWPFRRMFGVQEPASAVSSLLNLAAHCYMLSEIKSQFTVKSAPLVLPWYIFGAISINGWIWSTIFHTRDTEFTEFMDYACALSIVLTSFLSAVIRIFHRQRKMTAVMVAFPIIYFIEHVRYLYSGRIDYGYNMTVNILFGVSGCLMWFLWACFQYVAGRRYAWRMIAFTILSGVTLTLELYDFPPKYFIWDAHALWHLSTAPLLVLLYRFVIDDLKFLQSSSWRTERNLTKSN